VDLDGLARLRSPEGEAALATAAELAREDPLKAAAAMRASGYDADLAALALTLMRLRQRATAKFGDDADRLFLTTSGLEQATREVVARRRAARLAGAGVRRIADLGCGLGADSIAFARAGLDVLAVESDPLTAEAAEANVEALGLSARVEVRWADATRVDLSGVDAVFCDPARRTTDSGRRLFDPRSFSPPWSFVVGLAGGTPATVLKLAPGLDHALVPREAEAEWVSVDGDVVEAALWFGPLSEVPRRASVLRGGEAHELTGTGNERAPVAPRRRFLYDPDGAVVRAHLVADLAAGLGGTLADPLIAYVFADAATVTPFARCFEVIEELPFPLKRLRAALRARDVGRLEIRKRGVAVDPQRLRRELKLAGTGSAMLVLTRLADKPTALLCQPC
jgi:SAM-dependent methyltransferase